MPRIMNRLGWGIAGALAIALMASLAGVIYAGSIDPPAGVTTGTPTQEGLIFQPSDCTGFPIVVSASGSYKLAQDIMGCAATDGIQISANEVTLDLNGFLVNGVAGAAVGIRATSGTGVVVENGKVANWTGGGIFISSAESTVSDLVVRGNGNHGVQIFGPRSHVTDVTSVGNALMGVRVLGADAILSRVVATNNADDGILIGDRSILRDCTASFNGGMGGIYVNGAAGEITGCDAGNNTNDGIVAGNETLIQNNNVHDNGGNGIEAPGSRMRVIGNNVASNTARGIWVGGGASTVADNTSTNNGTDGYYIVGGGSRVDNNHSNGNNTGFRIANPSGIAIMLVRNTATEMCGGGGGYVTSGFIDAGPLSGAAASTGSPWNNIVEPCIP